MKILLPHFLWCHYEMLGIFLEYFKEHEVYIMLANINISEECKSWLRVYFDHFKFNLVIIKEGEDFSLEHKYDILVNHTDDIKFHNIIKDIFTFPKDLCIYHQNPPRTSVYRNYLPIHGIQNVYENGEYKYKERPYLSSAWNYIDVNTKLSKLSSNITVAVIGGIILEEDDLFGKLMRRFNNFEDITFYIMGRINIVNSDKVLPDNIKIVNFISAEEMFRLLSSCHYIYYFTEKKGIYNASGNIPLAYTTLCKIVGSKRLKTQYDINIGEFRDNDELFTLKEVDEKCLEELKNERDVIINNSKTNMDNLLKN